MGGGREGRTSKRQIRFSTQQFSASWPSPRLNVPVVDTALHSTYTVSTLHLERTLQQSNKNFLSGRYYKQELFCRAFSFNQRDSVKV